MASAVGDSELVDRYANECDTIGNDIDQIGRECVRQIRARIDADAWSGPAADRSLDFTDHQAHVLWQVNQELHDIVSALRSHAHWIRERERYLRDLELRIRAWCDAHPHSELEDVIETFEGLVVPFKYRFAGAAAQAAFGGKRLDAKDLTDLCKRLGGPVGHDGLPQPFTDGWESLASYLRSYHEPF